MDTTKFSAVWGGSKNLKCFHEYFLLVKKGGIFKVMAPMAELEPVQWNEAIKKKEWKSDMQEEMLAIEKNHTSNLVDLPKSKRPIDLKWMLKLKLKPDGSIVKHKARLVAR